jgi:geranylgeranyl diphosphate synthase, type II
MDLHHGLLIVTEAESLAAFLDAARLRVDAALEAYLPRPPACPPLVSEAMRYSVFAGGKRLRSVLALAAADAITRVKWGRGYFSAPVGGENIPVPNSPISLALPAACAIELIHTYSLIHDDLPAMDNDMLRRGRPTLHVVYGDGIAILAGDGLQAEAFGLLAREPATEDPEIVARKLRVLGVIAGAAGATGMVGGQAIDLQAAGQAAGHALTLDAEALRAMHARKTGALITAAAVSGSLIAGGDDRLIAAITEYAAELGLAFQIVDDVLDVEGDAKTLGKTAGKDAASAKPSYPALFGIDRSRAMAAECVARAKAALDQVGLSAGWLSPIADWVTDRTS